MSTLSAQASQKCIKLNEAKIAAIDAIEKYMKTDFEYEEYLPTTSEVIILIKEMKSGINSFDNTLIYESETYVESTAKNLMWQLRVKCDGSGYLDTEYVGSYDSPW